MTAHVVEPFPLARRTAFVKRHADIIGVMSPKSAERHLAYQLKVQRDALMRRVDAERTEREIASLEQAIVAASERESVA